MPVLPVRVELKSEACGICCRFTAGQHDFSPPPAKGDPIDFSYPGWEQRVLGIVQYVHHFVGHRPGAVVCCTISVPDKDAFILTFDMFKDAVGIVDLDSSSMPLPPPHYVAYRTVARLWGSKSFAHGHDSPIVLGELVRAMLLCGGQEPGPPLNRAVELVHKLLIEDKQRRRAESTSLLWLMRLLDSHGGALCTSMSNDDAAVVDVLRRALAQSRSVPPANLPACLRPQPA